MTDRSRLIALVRSLSLFNGLDDRSQVEVAELLDWFSFPGGATLFEAGESADALYIVMHGCLGAFARMPSGERRLVARISAGETVGEMALLTGRPRNATVMSLRDTEVARFSREAFEKLVLGNPRATLALARLSAERLEDSRKLSPGARSPQTLAVVPQSHDVNARAFAEQLAVALSRHRRTACAFAPADALPETHWFHQLEREHEIVIYVADATASPWSQACVRQADGLLWLADASQPPAELTLLGGQGRTRALHKPTELVLQHRGPIKRGAAGSWLAIHPELPLHHVGSAVDIQRLARHFVGRSVGLVLSGGAARGFAHIGVVRALRERGVPIDLVGGSSIGAIVAAAVASGWDYDEMLTRFRRTFVDQNPLGDYTLPLVSLVSGRRVNRLLQQEFGDVAIEDLPIPFFCCSTNLTQGRLAVHRSGELWRWLRASIAIPGILPPAEHGGELLVDGGLMRNLPIDVLQEFGPGRMLAVDVGPGRAIRAVAKDEVKPPSLWDVLPFIGRSKSAPSIFDILIRSAMVNSTAAASALRSRVDLLFQPPLEGLDLLDWSALERGAEIGYRHAVELLDAPDAPEWLSSDS